MPLIDALFVWRGRLLLVPAVLALWWGQLSCPTFIDSLPMLGGGIALRCWATAHLGGAGRTVSSRAPAERVVTGPFASLSHPLYTANLAIALGLLLALRPPTPLVVVLVLTVVGFYGLLAMREDVQLLDLRARAPRPPPSFRQVARHERSTWLVLGLFLVLAV